jgi:phosphoglycerate dehydrogenase-like enzyme
MVNIEGARKARVPICSNGGANSVAVAEHAIMLMLAVYRKLIAFHQNVAAGHWHGGIPRAVNIFEIDGKTVGLVGFGNIGEQVARRLRGFNARIVYYDSARRAPAEEAALDVEYVPLDQLLARADIVSLHMPLNESTRGVIGRDALSRMKTGAVLINTCRGEVVDEEALMEALREGRLLGAGLDTLQKEPTDSANPILRLPNVVLTPHSAGPTVDSFRKRFQNGYQNIERVAKGERPLWVIAEMRDLFA